MSPADGACRCMLCVDYGDRGDWDDGDRVTIDHVGRFGLSCITVGPTSDADPPPYVFTTGLWHSHRQPELAIYGVGDFGVMIAALNEIARQATLLGRSMRAGDHFAGALATPGVAEDAYRVTLAAVHPSWWPSQFGTALYFNRANAVDFLQVVWPDRAGRLPGDAAFDPCFADRQPLLWIPAPEHPPSVWATDEARAIVPGRLRRVLDDAATTWETTGDGLDRLAYAVGITLDWLQKATDAIRDLLPDGIEYRAARAFVAWSDGTGTRDSLGDALRRAARELAI